MTIDHNYTVTGKYPKPVGWCGYRFILILSIVVSVVVYTAGAVVTGVVYRAWNRRANCTSYERDRHTGEWKEDQNVFDYNTPLVVVGPAFMAVGGAILLFLIFQWSFCRPAIMRWTATFESFPAVNA